MKWARNGKPLLLLLMDKQRHTMSDQGAFSASLSRAMNLYELYNDTISDQKSGWAIVLRATLRGTTQSDKISYGLYLLEPQWHATGNAGEQVARDRCP